MSQKFQVLWTNIAMADIAQIVKYIAYDSPVIAEKTCTQIETKANSLESLPFRVRVVPEFEKKLNITQFREIIEQNWRIIYFVENHNVVISSIIDARRNFEEIMSERFKNQK
jgi:plasmid stabilization system protein ParE